MSKDKSDQWWDQTWGLWEGCTPVSPGCDHCWARAMLRRFEPKRKPTIRGASEKSLKQPHSWRRPRRVFVCPRSDFFHEYPRQLYRPIALAFDVMQQTPQHTYYILTKRPENIPSWRWPSHVWRGVSIENQEWADKRRPLLRYGKKLFLSCEPLLGPIDLGSGVAAMPESWVIVGAESGSQYRSGRNQLCHFRRHGYCRA